MARLIVLGIFVLQLFLPLFSPGCATATTVKATAWQPGASSKAGQQPAASSKARQQKGVSSVPGQQTGASSTTGQQAGASSTTGQILRRPPSVQTKVVNIVVDKIEGGSIYSKDGRKFSITGAAKVIDNRNLKIRKRTAELMFENGSLVTVELK